ncbi:MAG: hypothetical protein JWQ90_1520 [Hydrocarboniphaga sp.]|uniref:DUF2188 domain-containing protein n=1 Tax=Hydrocarboniphaga sp. TaxID=2033016 RepID=UPI0026153B2A|nr:DUF2188 domain-containing protein [Hydrocarboniphaga sp.]MDB5969070.1 hypothetical protein [Hydrocarboniphaga sp.]
MKKDGGNNLFVEKHPNGFAVLRPGADRASAVKSTQGEAIDRAREINPKAAVHVERVRHTTVGKPDQWRKP